jgi:hypothetical protein
MSGSLISVQLAFNNHVHREGFLHEYGDGERCSLELVERDGGVVESISREYVLVFKVCDTGEYIMGNGRKIC